VTPVPPVERGEEPDRNAGERELLVSWLDWHRATMARKCAGLTPTQLGLRSCPPSELTLLGLVRHLTEIERNYYVLREYSRHNGHADLLRQAIDGATGE
jgi:hypothetical protein